MKEIKINKLTALSSQFNIYQRRCLIFKFAVSFFDAKFNAKIKYFFDDKTILKSG